MQTAQKAVGSGVPDVKITDLKVHLNAGCKEITFATSRLMTSEPGLYGVGCATHAEEPLAVATILEKYMKPQILGRNVSEIEDIWQSSNIAPYWRGGVDANNALSGVDGALWDIMGKRAGAAGI